MQTGSSGQVWEQLPNEHGCRDCSPDCLLTAFRSSARGWSSQKPQQEAKALNVVEVHRRHLTCSKNYVITYGSKGASPVTLVVKNPPANAGDTRDVGLMPGLGRSPAGGPGNPLRYSCLENPMDRGAWWAGVHGVAKSRARLRGPSTRVRRRQLGSWI